MRPVEPTIPQPVTKSEIAAWIIIAGAMLFVFFQHLVAGLVAGLLFYRILDGTSSLLSRRISSTRAVRPLALVTASLVAGAIVVGAIITLVSMLKSQMSNIPALMTKMAEILESTRVWLQGFGGVQILPDAVRDAEDLKTLVVDWLKTHSDFIKGAGGSASIALLHIVMGLLVAVLVFFRHIRIILAHEPVKPLSYFLTQKMWRLSDAFGQIVAAQVKISAINTVLTGIYLLVILPLFGNALPFTPTILLITFVAGLIPVLGNLISNTVIVIVSLGTSVGTAIASLTFLVLIHKLEYLVNSRIVGIQTSSQAWEILIAVLVGEAAFGVPGVVMAPILYAFVKRELREKDLI